MSKNSLHAHIKAGKIWLEVLKACEKGRGYYTAPKGENAKEYNVKIKNK